MFQHMLFFLQSLVGNVIGKRMEAVVDDDMEVEQEIVVIPVKDAELFEAYSTSHGVTTIHLNNNSKPSEAVVCKICSLKVTSKWGVNPSTMLKKKRMIRRKKYRYFEG